ncbi:MAG: hypothetical protein FJX71_05595 [Alphaproteobacteria bacterium]|nr:hypothetical protein [Alphaproteobacteria bacterium]
MTRPPQLLLNLPLQPNYSENDLIVSSHNWEAHQWIQRWPNWTMRMVALYGHHGCGKTHLAHIWQEKSHALFIKSSDIKYFTPLDIIQRAQAFIFDDIDIFFQNDESLSGNSKEDWMFHFYNLAKEKEIDLLFCSLQPPTHWNVKLPDLKSRLATILSVEILSPDEEALEAILFKLCSEMGMSLTEEVKDYILRRIERSFESVQAFVKMLNTYTLSTHRQLTLGLVREALNDKEP